MSKNKNKRNIKTPSGDKYNAKKDGPIEVIINKMQPEALVDIITGDNSLKTIVNKLDAQTEFLSVTANMMMAITGYILGEKGLTYKSEYGNLKGKIKNSSPILGDAPVNDKNGGMLAVLSNGSNGNTNNCAKIVMAFESLDGKGIDQLYNIIQMISNEYDVDNLEDIVGLSMAFNLINDIIKEINNIDFSKISDDTIKDIKLFSNVTTEFINTLSFINKNTKDLFVFSLFAGQMLALAPALLSNFIVGNKGNGGIVKLMESVNTANNKAVDIATISSFFESVVGLMVVVKKLNKSKVSPKNIKKLSYVVGKLNDIIEKVNKTDIKELTVSRKKLSNIADYFRDLKDIMVAASICGLFAIPAAIGIKIVAKTIKFLLNSINEIVNIINESEISELGEQSFEPIAKIIIFMGIIMAIAALVGGLVIANVVNIIGFAVVFSVFNLLILGAINIATKGFTEAQAYALENIHKVIITCTIIMVLGALFMKTGLWKESLLFGLVLGAFIFTVLLPFTIIMFIDKLLSARKLTKGGQSGILGYAKDISLLIVTCTIIMALGALFMKTGLAGQALLFGAVLGLFIRLVISPFKMLMRAGKHLDRTIKQITIMIVTCTLVLMLGALFMQNKKLVKGAIGFAALLAGFIWAVVLAFKVAGKSLIALFKPLLMLTILIVVSAAVLLIGATFMEDYGWAALGFAALLGTFIFAMALICKFMGNNADDILAGEGLMAIIVVITIGAVYALSLLGDAFNKFGDIGTMFASLGALGALILGIAGIAIALGGLMMTGLGAAAFGLGVACLAGLGGVILLIGIAVDNLSHALVSFAEASEIQIDHENLMKLLTVVGEIGTAVVNIVDKLDEDSIDLAIKFICGMGVGINTIGIAVANIASLNIVEEWDAQGNPIKFRNMKDSDFESAANNVSKIVSTIGTAMVDIYSKNPELFKGNNDPGIFSFITGKPVNKIDAVIKFCSGIGAVISNIAMGVKDMADLRVVDGWDSEGKPISWRKLNDSDFKLASDNIGKIVTTIGASLINLYNSNAEMFQKPKIDIGWGLFRLSMEDSDAQSPIERVLSITGQMGGAIVNIAKGLSLFAEMKFPTEWDSNGNPIKFADMKNGTVFKDVTNNIKIAISTLFDALQAVYTDDKTGIFKRDVDVATAYKEVMSGNRSITMLSDPEKVTAVLSQMAQATVLTIDAIAKVSEMKKLTGFDSNGNPTYEKFDLIKDKDTVINFISTALTVPLEALIKLYKNPDYKDTFDTGIFSGQTKISKVITAIKEIPSVITGLINNISEILNLSYKDNTGKDVVINGNDLAENSKLFYSLYNTVSLPIVLLGRIYKGKGALLNNSIAFITKFNKKTQNEFKDVITTLSGTSLNIVKMFDKDISKEADNYNTVIEGIIKPFASDSFAQYKVNRFNNFYSQKKVWENIDLMTKSINTLDDSKVDKFIQLTDKLLEFQEKNSGDINAFIQLLNTKVNSTLTELADRIEYAANIIMKSDEMQDKRNKFIKENTKKLKEVMEMPMKIELTKDDFDMSSIASSASSNKEVAESDNGNTSNNFMQPQYTQGVSDETESNIISINNNVKNILEYLQNQ